MNARVAVLSIHPAPYRDPCFELVTSRNCLDLEVFSLQRGASNHAYWKLNPPRYSNHLLEQELATTPTRSFTEILAIGRFDVVVVPGHNEPISREAMRFCRENSVPWIWTIDSVEERGRPFFRSFLRHLLHASIARTASALWIPGKAARSYFEALGVDPGRIFEGCYCLDPAAGIAKSGTRERVRTALGVKPSACVVLFVGEMIPSRRLTDLVQALAALAHEKANVVMLAIGRGEDSLRVKGLSKELGVRALLPGPVSYSDLADMYAAADVYAHPGHEPYSLSLYAAALNGLPIVCSNQVGAAEDCVASGVNGHVFEEGVVSELVEGLRRFVQDPTSAKAMGALGRERACARTPDWAAQQFETAVAMALQSHPRTVRG